MSDEDLFDDNDTDLEELLGEVAPSPKQAPASPDPGAADDDEIDLDALLGDDEEDEDVEAPKLTGPDPGAGGASKDDEDWVRVPFNRSEKFNCFV